MIDETRSWGIEVPLVVADGGYGDAAAFRLGLEERGLGYAVGISTTTTARPETAQPHTPPYSGRGPRPQPAYPESAQTVKKLVIEAGKQAARPVQWREGSRPGTGRSGVRGVGQASSEAELEPVDEALAASLLEQGEAGARALGLLRDAHRMLGDERYERQAEIAETCLTSHLIW